MKTTFQFKNVSGLSVSDDELLEDLKRAAIENGGRISIPKYESIGSFDPTTISRRFGTWNNALKKAGINLSNEINISDERLFENVLNLWQKYGRQPVRKELDFPPSIFSQGPYNRRFGSWSNSLRAFVDFMNSMDSEFAAGPIVNSAISTAKRTPRDPNLRLRYYVLKRDNFTCRMCGASPAKDPSVVLHIDHIVAWSNGGETVVENLQALCSQCNLGKSNF